MKNNKGLTLVALVITIIVMLILAGISLSLVLGDRGILTRATTVEVEYNKSEVLEDLNVLITEKYLDAYSKSSADGNLSDFSEFYSPEKVIQFLLGHTGGETGSDYTTEDATRVIEPINNVVTIENYSECYYVITSQLRSNIKNFGQGENKPGTSDIFYLSPTEDDTTNEITGYALYYMDASGATQKIGDLDINPTP